MGRVHIHHLKQWIEIQPVADVVFTFLLPFMTKAESLPIAKSEDGVGGLNHQSNRMIMNT